jgi:hypothetical protein
MSKRIRKTKSEVKVSDLPEFNCRGVLNVKALPYGRRALSGVIENSTGVTAFIESTTMEPGAKQVECRLVVQGPERTVVGSLVLPTGIADTERNAVLQLDGKRYRVQARWQSFERTAPDGAKQAVRRFRLGNAVEQPIV